MQQNKKPRAARLSRRGFLQTSGAVLGATAWPSGKTSPAADPVKKKYLPQFERRRDELLALLDGFETLKRVHNLAQLTRMANGRE